MISFIIRLNHGIHQTRGISFYVCILLIHSQTQLSRYTIHDYISYLGIFIPSLLFCFSVHLILRPKCQNQQLRGAAASSSPDALVPNLVNTYHLSALFLCPVYCSTVLMSWQYHVERGVISKVMRRRSCYKSPEKEGLFQKPWVMFNNWNIKISSEKSSTISMSYCKTAVTPVHQQWSYCSIALSHRYILNLTQLHCV